MWGADVQGLHALAKAITDEGQRVGEQATSLNSMLDGTPWQGPDADAFKNQEWPTHLKALQSAADALQLAGAAAEKNATAQEQASQG
jgi:hypothetical protein